MKRLFLLVLLLIAQPAFAQSWTTSARTATWTTSATIGDGVDRFTEVSTSAQGGDPPALAYEPAAIDENSLYTRSAWITSSGIVRTDNGEAKFRITCNFSHFGMFDPILYYGEAPAGHHHTFIGNKAVNQNSTYASLRNSPASSCSGGPLNATAYWEPTLFFEIATDVFVPVKPNVVSFYYTISPYSVTERLYRLPRGLAFIGGVDPSDRLNTARLAEIPNGAGWLKTRRYNGWGGWQCYSGASVILPASGNTADQNGTSYVRQLVNEDGSDPWGGACEGTDKTLIANVGAPTCWDGYNLTSPNGRDHFRYPIWQSSDQSPSAYKCPDGWWQLPHFEVKTEFPNGRSGGPSGHAWRSKLHLSSDRMDPNPANWHPRGSTFHFDWMNGWDSVVQETWQINCTGIAINGTAGNPLTCDTSTISATQRMIGTAAASPDTSLSNDPVVTIWNYAARPAREAFGPVESGTVVNATIGHTH